MYILLTVLLLKLLTAGFLLAVEYFYSVILVLLLKGMRQLLLFLCVYDLSPGLQTRR